MYARAIPWKTFIFTSVFENDRVRKRTRPQYHAQELPLIFQPFEHKFVYDQIDIWCGQCSRLLRFRYRESFSLIFIVALLRVVRQIIIKERNVNQANSKHGYTSFCNVCLYPSFVRFKAKIYIPIQTYIHAHMHGSPIFYLKETKCNGKWSLFSSYMTIYGWVKGWMDEWKDELLVRRD